MDHWAPKYSGFIFYQVNDAITNNATSSAFGFVKKFVMISSILKRAVKCPTQPGGAL